MNLEELKRDVLATDDVKKSIQALEQCAAICHDLAANAIKAFAACPDDGYLIFERLILFGSLIGEFAWTEYQRVTDERKKILLTVLLHRINYPGFDAIYLNQISNTKVDDHLYFYINYLRDDLSEKAIPILIKHAHHLFQHTNLGQSFKFNPNQEALASILDYLKKNHAGFVEEFSGYMVQKDSYPLEIQRLLN